jgi:UDP-galactopyranose mutase
VQGGIQALTDTFACQLEQIICDTRVVKIFPQKKKLLTAGGLEVPYRALVITAPLTELAELIEDLPHQLQESLSLLRCVSVMCVNLGVDRDRISNLHWFYLPEEQFLFFRVGFPANFSPLVVPEWCSSVYADFCYLGTPPCSDQEAVEMVVDALRHMRILRRRDKVVVSEVVHSKFGYVVMDGARASVVLRVRQYLEQFEIYLCGRFAEWDYMSMEDVLVSASNLARRISGGASDI